MSEIALAILELIAVESLFLAGLGLAWLIIGKAEASPIDLNINPAASAWIKKGAAAVLILDLLIVTILLARSNLLDGWDECVYIISARSLLGRLPPEMFRFDRPPLTSIFAALSSPVPWLGTIVMLWGSQAFLWRTAHRLELKHAWLVPLMLIFNGYLLPAWVDINSEIVAILFISAAIWAIAAERPAIAGAAAALALLARWNLAPLLPLTLFFIWRAHGRRALLISAGAASAVLAPFAVWWTIKLGTPWAPIISNFKINTAAETVGGRSEIYLFLNLVWPFSVVVTALVGYLYQRINRIKTPAAIHVAIGLALVEIAVLPFFAKKDFRFLVPFAPALYLAAGYYILRLSGARRALIPIFAALIIYAGHFKSGWEELKSRETEYLRTSSAGLIEKINRDNLTPVYYDALPQLEVYRLLAGLDQPAGQLGAMTGSGYFVSQRPRSNACPIKSAGKISLYRFPCGR